MKDYKPYELSDPTPFCEDGHDIKFILRVDNEDIELDQTIMVALSSNLNGCLNYFLAGLFKNFPSREDFMKGDYYGSKNEKEKGC